MERSTIFNGKIHEMHFKVVLPIGSGEVISKFVAGSGKKMRAVFKSKAVQYKLSLPTSFQKKKKTSFISICSPYFHVSAMGVPHGSSHHEP